MGTNKEALVLTMLGTTVLGCVLTVFCRAPVLTEWLHTFYWLKLSSWCGLDFNL